MSPDFQVQHEFDLINQFGNVQEVDVNNPIVKDCSRLASRLYNSIIFQKVKEPNLIRKNIRT